jgi:hypothetical protein
MQSRENGGSFCHAAIKLDDCRLCNKLLKLSTSKIIWQ